MKTKVILMSDGDLIPTAFTVAFAVENGYNYGTHYELEQSGYSELSVAVFGVRVKS